MNTDILFCGDVHGALRHVVDTTLRLRPMAVVLLGDIESPRPLHLELAPIREITWWICGNHDTDRPDSWSNLVDSELTDRRLDGRVVTLPDGTRLGGLGGVFRQEIWYPPEPPSHESYEDWLASLQMGRRKPESVYETKRLKHRSSIFRADYVRLANQKADILVTHEAGAAHRHGVDAIDELASAMGVKTTFHGHHHSREDYGARSGELGFNAFGVGLRGITNREGEVVVRGEVDERRAGRGVR